MKTLLLICVLIISSGCAIPIRIIPLKKKTENKKILNENEKILNVFGYDMQLLCLAMEKEGIVKFEAGVMINDYVSKNSNPTVMGFRNYLSETAMSNYNDWYIDQWYVKVIKNYNLLKEMENGTNISID